MNLLYMKLLFALAIIPAAVVAQSGDFTIHGETGHQDYNNKFVKLYYTHDSVKVVDSVVIVDGHFEFSGHVEMPLAGKLSMGSDESGDRIDVFLSAGTILVSTADSLCNACIGGTTLAKDHDRLTSKYRQAENELYGVIRQLVAMPDGDQKKAFFTEKVSPEMDRYTTLKKESVNEFVTENPNSYVSLYHLDKSAVGRMTNYETTYPYYKLLSQELKETPLGKELGKRLLAAKSDFTGKVYTDFVSTTPDGQELNLKEIVDGHKYVLLDFWASWCGPCRKENPHVVETYNTFKDQGFTVLSVSLDEDAAKWKAAIEQDGMPWYHASSLQGWKEPAGRLYDVRAIPQNFLIDHNGTIVAVNLRGSALSKKIGELMN